MTTPTRFRKKFEPIAVRFDGGNVAEVDAFTRATTREGGFRLRADHNGVQVAEVYDYLHDTWVGVKVGDWVARGQADEHYPIDQTVLADTYEPVGAA